MSDDTTRHDADKPQTISDLKQPEQRNDQPAGSDAYKGDDPAAEQAKVNLEDKANATKRNTVRGENVNRP